MHVRKRKRSVTKIVNKNLDLRVNMQLELPTYRIVFAATEQDELQELANNR